MSKFKIGDKIKIKPEVKSGYNKIRNKIVTVKHVEHDCHMSGSLCSSGCHTGYRFEEDDSMNNENCWCDIEKNFELVRNSFEF